MMYVTVRYYKPQLSGYAGMAYTYRTSLPLKAGDKVIAPHILPLLREITQYDTEEEQA